MLQNEYLLPKIGFDTAENEPARLWQICQASAEFANELHIPAVPPTRRCMQSEIDVAEGISRQITVHRAVLPTGTSYFAKIGKILPIFGGLVLGCIKTKFCKKICV